MNRPSVITEESYKILDNIAANEDLNEDDVTFIAAYIAGLSARR